MSDCGWDDLILQTEENIKRTELKVIQLKALLRTFHRQRAEGDPTPREVAEQARA